MNTSSILLALVQLPVVAFLLVERVQERRRTDAMIERLCQRIQAPAAAVLEHDEKVRAVRTAEYAPPAIDPEDDEAYWEHKSSLAEQMMAQEVEQRGR